MSSSTENLNLYKVDPSTDGENTFNVQIMLNDNWNKIDNAFQTKANKPVALIQNVLINTTSKEVATYTPTANGNYEIKTYLRVATASTNVSIAVSYMDSAGTQTKYITFQNGGLFFSSSNGVKQYNVGSYVMVPLFINAVANTPITVTATVNTINQAYVSCAIVGV